MGSSKKTTVGYRYYVGMLLLAVHGMVDKIVRIRVDKKDAWRGKHSEGPININAGNLFGGDSREGGISGTVDFLNGSAWQGVNSYLQANLGSVIPAWRGLSGLVLRQVYIGLNPYLKSWDARIQRIHSRDRGRKPQWYDDRAEIPIDYEYTYDALETGWDLYGSTPLGSNLYRYDRDRSSPMTQTKVFSDGSGETKNVTLRVRGLVEFKEYIGGEQISEHVIKGGAPASTGFNVYYISISSPSATYYLNSGVSEYVLSEINETFEVQITDGATVTLGYSTVDDIIVDQYQHLDMVVQTIGEFGSMNPAHIIRECLTENWGMGHPESDIDDDSFRAAADRLFNEKMGICILWDQQSDVKVFIDEIKQHIDASVYVDETSGKFKIKLVRDDYNADDLITLGPDEIVKIENYKRPKTSELINSVTVNYWDCAKSDSGSITVHNTALVQIQRRENNTVVNYDGFSYRALADRAARRDLISLSTPLLACTIYANRSAALLNIGDVFKFEWPDEHNGAIVMRVNNKALGDGRRNTVKIECVEDVFSLPGQATTGGGGTGWEDPNQPPEPAEWTVVVEAPYYEIVQRFGQAIADEQLASAPESGFLLATAARSKYAINAEIAVDAGSGFEDIKAVDFCPFAQVAFLTPRVENGVPVTEIYFVNAIDLDLINVGTFAQIGDELVRIDSVETNHLIVGRGVLDTVPKNHSAGTGIYFWDEYAESDEVEYVQGETVDVKILPVSGAGRVSLDDAETNSLTFAARAIRPYPPADVTLNGEYWPETAEGDLMLAWKYRNRIQQTAVLIDWFEDSIPPEEGTTTTIRFYSEDGLIREEAGITDSTYTYTNDQEREDNGGRLATDLTIELLTVRDGHESFQTVTISIGRLTAPVYLHATHIGAPLYRPYRLKAD